jgi:hypothetical protein
MTPILRPMRQQARIESLNPDIRAAEDYSGVDGETRVGRIYKECIARGL